MRLKHGDKISLFNSKDGEWDVKILRSRKDLIEFKVEKLPDLYPKKKIFGWHFLQLKKVLKT